MLLSYCKRIYGVDCREDLRQDSEDFLLCSPVTIEDFLRAMIAAAVNEWVFDGRHESMPNDLNSASDLFQFVTSLA